MEEDVEGIDSLGPDLKEGHRRSFNGALGGTGGGVGERIGQGGRGGRRRKT